MNIPGLSRIGLPSLLPVWLFFFSTPAHPAILDVPSGPYPDIQSGIDGASTGDTVLVADGVYYENLRIEGLEFTLASGFILDQDTLHIENTIIDGSVPVDPDEGSVICFLPGGAPHSAPWIVGITIRNGLGRSVWELVGVPPDTMMIQKRVGGGVYIEEMNPVFYNNLFQDNDGDDEGGGSYTFMALPNFGGPLPGEQGVNPGLNRFVNNSADLGNTFFVKFEGDPDSIYADNCDFDVYDYAASTLSDVWATAEDGVFSFLNSSGSATLQADTVYVDPAGDDGNSGLLPGEAFKHVYHALNQVYADSLEPLTIHLAAGTYSPSITQEEFPLQIPDWVTLEGEGEDLTILDADNQSNLLLLEHCRGAVIRDLTLTGGSAANQQGGAIFCLGSELYCEGLTLSYGYTNYGGGMYLQASNVTLSDTRFEEISSLSGGGVYSTGGTLEIDGCFFNQCEGVGLVFYGERPDGSPEILSIHETVFANNSGGAVTMLWGALELGRTTFTNNYSPEAGLYCADYEWLDISSCIFWQNSYYEIGLELDQSGAPARIVYSDVQDLDIYTTESTVDLTTHDLIDQDPLFTNPYYWDYSLSWANYPVDDSTKSPCIDTGDHALFDPDGSRADMGALYFNQDSGIPPTAFIGADTTFGMPPLLVVFTDQSVIGSEEIVAWLWDFGDDSTSTEQHPQHIYENPGIYSVSLTVTDAADSSDTCVETDLIETAADGTVVEGGPVDGTWSAAGSPYYVNGDLTVPQGSDLLVESGVRVEFLGRYGLTIEGGFGAIGTETDSILFTSYDTTGFSDLYYEPSAWYDPQGSWRGITVDRSARTDDSARFEHCVLEFAVAAADQGEGGGAIRLLDAGSVQLSDSRIRNCLSWYYGGGIYSRDTELSLENLLVENCYAGDHGGGIAIANTAEEDYACSIDEVQVLNNAACGDGGGLSIYDANPTMENLLVSGNTAENEAGGLLLSSSHAVMQYLSITGNTAVRKGGGILLDGSNALIEDAVLADNVSGYPGGGGAYIYMSEPEFRRVTISGNDSETGSSSGGGGLYLHYSDALLENLEISGNNSDGGGGILLSASNPTMELLEVRANSADWGGGVAMSGSDPVIGHSVVSNNVATTYYGGGLSLSNSDPHCEHLCVTGNSAPGSGGGIQCSSNANPVLANCILSNDSPQEISCTSYGDASSITADHCDIQGGEAGIETNGNGVINWLDGNIDLDPLFLEPDSSDFSLSGDSPCIDAGTAFFAWEGDTLVNMAPEDYVGEAPDMGAFEFELPGSPTVWITLPAEDQVQLSWDPVPGAASYNVYSSTDPYSGFALATNTTGTVWLTAIAEEQRFYYVTAQSAGHAVREEGADPRDSDTHRHALRAVSGAAMSATPASAKPGKQEHPGNRYFE